MKRSLLNIILFLSILSTAEFAQLKIHEFPAENRIFQDSVLFGNYLTRSIFPLTDDWELSVPGAEEVVTGISIPVLVDGGEELFFERKLDFINNGKEPGAYQIYFNGLNYSAEIFINDASLYKHSGGEAPFHLTIPSEDLKYDGTDKISILLNHELDARTTIPLLQRHLFPKNVAGIRGEIFALKLPAIAISEQKNKISAVASGEFDFELISVIENLFSGKSADPSKSVILSFSIETADGNKIYESPGQNIELKIGERKTVKFKDKIRGVIPWSPSNPQNYFCNYKIIENGIVIDRTRTQLSFIDLRIIDEKLALNSEPFAIRGVTYISSPLETDYSKVISDLRIIKDLGMNTVRFAKALPSPHLLRQCAEIGLLAFIEIPFDNIPEDIYSGANFSERVNTFIARFTEAYFDFQIVAAVGCGSGFNHESLKDLEFSGMVSKSLQNSMSRITYASYPGCPSQIVEGIDLYGIQLFANPLEQSMLNTSIPKGRIFISEATYPVYNGGTNGYLNEFSYEAQAKYFENLISAAISNQLGGFVLNSFVDYTGDYTSMFAGYDKNNTYPIGIVRKDKNPNTISYQVISAKLNETKKVTIPIGTRSSDTPLFFIITGLILTFLLGITVNSKRKFREDVTRALIRPYNFFSDIRDLRILSGLQTHLLSVLLAGSFALLTTNVTYYFKDNLFLEKLIISFGSAKLINFASYLAWEPYQAGLIFFIVCIILFILCSLLIKSASMFNKTKVFFSSIYYVVIWSFLPLALILPLELVLFKILSLEAFNLYFFAGLIIFGLWIIQRLLKGVYVIFDIPAVRVYSFGLGFFILFFGGLIIYLQIDRAVLSYIINTVVHFKYPI